MRELAVSRIENPRVSQFVFEGTVERQVVTAGPIGAPIRAMSMTTDGEHRAVTFRASRVYRGQVPDEVVVLTGAGGGDCGFDFDRGKQYLVHANKADDGTLFTSICTGTALLEESGPALRFLRGEPATVDDLLDPMTYYLKFQSTRTGKACGRVSRPDGTPLGQARVEMSQLRDEPLPPKTASDPDESKDDGTFCIQNISPGKYLLAAERNDYESKSRWMGFYSDATKPSDATSITIRAGDKLSGLQFVVQRQALYLVKFRLVTSDGIPVRNNYLRITIKGADQDPLAYDTTNRVNDLGFYTFNYIPPGRYLVSSFLLSNDKPGQPSTEALKWQPVKMEVQVTGNSEFVVKLSPAR